MWRTLTQPLNPRAELWVRRVFGAAQATLAVWTGATAIRLTLALYLDATSPRAALSYRAFDPHGFGFMTLVVILVPITVLLAFGSASVWRKWSVPWWLPLLTIIGLDGVARAVLP
jgi:hypothetical protein